jgi:AraC family transcriptional regulator
MASRKNTTVDHRERLNRVLVYMEEHMNRPLKLEELASLACFSPFHFHRIFTAYVGETMSEYIRRIRLEKALHKLSYTDEPITSIALSAGYETPAAFTKAFRQHFGTGPAELRKTRKPKPFHTAKLLDLNETIKEVTVMQPEIRTMPEQRVLFVRKTGRYDKVAAEAWSTLMGFAYSRRLMGKNTRGIGISRDNPDITPEEKIRYDACITIDKDVKPEDEIGIQTLNGGRYAVFLHKGPYDKLGETYNAIFSGWFPSSGERLRDAPYFEVYLNRDPRRTKPENLRTEICIPIE